jgi:hypothetical protein
MGGRRWGLGCDRAGSGFLAGFLELLLYVLVVLNR